MSTGAKTFAVWEEEYPEDGCTHIEAVSADDAMQKYREMTGETEEDPVFGWTPLCASIAGSDARKGGE